MTLTKRQLDILNHAVVDGQAWTDNAKEAAHVIAKIARLEPIYDEAVAKGNYKNRATREAETVANDPHNRDNWTPMQKWEFAMKKQERMSGLNRDTENLITDNPTFIINEYTKTKYDDKVALRATKPEA